MYSQTSGITIFCLDGDDKPIISVERFTSGDRICTINPPIVDRLYFTSIVSDPNIRRVNIGSWVNIYSGIGEICLTMMFNIRRLGNGIVDTSMVHQLMDNLRHTYIRATLYSYDRNNISILERITCADD
jgi:hypothetical protein